jgi:hypothetical protein
LRPIAYPSSTCLARTVRLEIVDFGLEQREPIPLALDGVQGAAGARASTRARRADHCVRGGEAEKEEVTEVTEESDLKNEATKLTE